MIKVNGQEIVFEEFPNGETKLNSESVVNSLLLISSIYTGGYDSRVDFKYENDSDLIKLMFVKRYLDDLNIDNVALNIYYMPYSRMDRSENKSPFTLKYVTEFINSLGFENVKVTEPHSDVAVALLNNVDAYYINFKLIQEVQRMIMFNHDEDYIVFPDGGAQKRYSKMKAKNTLVCYKHRDFETGQITSLELVGDTSRAYGKTAIIVDDLSSYGGTFVHTANKLREQGFLRIVLLVAHAENSIFKGELFNHVDKVFTTDSILSDKGNIDTFTRNNILHVFKIEGDVY